MEAPTASNFFVYDGNQYPFEIQRLDWDELIIEVQIEGQAKIYRFALAYFETDFMPGCNRPVVSFPLTFSSQDIQYNAQVHFKSGKVFEGNVCLEIETVKCAQPLTPGERIFFHVPYWPDYRWPETIRNAYGQKIPDKSVFSAYGREWIIRNAFSSKENDIPHSSDLCRGKGPFTGGKSLLLETSVQENDNYGQLCNLASNLLRLESMTAGTYLEWKTVFVYRQRRYVRVEKIPMRHQFEKPRINVTDNEPGDVIRCSMGSYEGNEAFWGCACHYFQTSLCRPTDAGIALLVEFPLLEMLADKCYLTIAEAFTGEKYGKLVTEDDKKLSVRNLNTIIGKEQSVAADTGDTIGTFIDMWRNPDKKHGGPSYKNKISSLFRYAGYTQWVEPQASADLSQRNAVAHNLMFSVHHTEEAFGLFRRITLKTYLLMMAMLGYDGTIDFFSEKHKLSELMPDFRNLSLASLREAGIKCRGKFDTKHRKES